MFRKPCRKKKIVRIADEINRNENGQRVKLALNFRSVFIRENDIQQTVEYPAHDKRDSVLIPSHWTIISSTAKIPRWTRMDSMTSESLYALDLPFFEAQLKALLAGEEVGTPPVSTSTSGNGNPVGRNYALMTT